MSGIIKNLVSNLTCNNRELDKKLVIIRNSLVEVCNILNNKKKGC